LRYLKLVGSGSFSI